MCPSGVERNDHLRHLIGRIELGDLEADGRIGIERVLALELGDLLAVGKDGNDWRPRDFSVVALGLGVAERGFHAALGDLLRLRHRALLAAPGLDPRCVVLGRDVGGIEIFRILLLDRLGKAQGGECHAGKSEKAEQTEGDKPSEKGC
jgi:hypothetical protein